MDALNLPSPWRMAGAALALLLAVAGCQPAASVPPGAPPSGQPPAKQDAQAHLPPGRETPSAGPRVDPHADVDKPAPEAEGLRRSTVPPVSSEPLGKGPGKLALVFDDLGWGQPGSAELLAMKGPFTFAVLPHTPQADEVVQAARRGGHEVFLHLPMEPQDAKKNDPGPYAIRTGMDAAEIRRRVNALLDAVPGVVGVNNHMGSRATEVPELMRTVLEVLRDRKLPFVDSYTSARSVAAAEAARLGVPVAVNGLFIDVVRDPARIKMALRKAAREAQKRGEFLAIGHPHPTVVAALREMLPEMAAAGIELVPARTLTHAGH